MDLANLSVAVLTADYFEESEVLFPYYRLLSEVGQVSVASSDGNSVMGKGGLVAFPVQLSFDELKVGDFDAVLIPGGFAPDLVRRSASALDFVRSMDKAGKPVGMICHGAWVAVSAGILTGRRVTSVSVVRPEVEGAGAEWVNEQVVVDGNLVTAQVPKDLGPWLDAFLGVLASDAGVQAGATRPAH